jgi:hypothetical protein
MKARPTKHPGKGEKTEQRESTQQVQARRTKPMANTNKQSTQQRGKDGTKREDPSPS